MPTVAVLSIGDMGLGIGRLLISKQYRVITSSVGRSESTLERARTASIELFDSDTLLVQQADYILSIVPPRDALSIGIRVDLALRASSTGRVSPLYYLDLNAIAPETVEKLALLLSPHHEVRFVDGSIIGGPPQPQPIVDGRKQHEPSWAVPSIPVSGPHTVPKPLATHLNVRCISQEIGRASALKMCFASLTKGFTALAIQSFATAKAMGVFAELKSELRLHVPDLATRAERGIASCPPKAYRWIREMQEIRDTFACAGFGEQEDARGGSLFSAIAEVYRFISEDTRLNEMFQDKVKTPGAEEIIEECVVSLSDK